MSDRHVKTTKGWSWFDRDDGASSDEPNSIDELPTADHVLRKAYAQCFSTQDGERVLTHLRAITLDRAFGPAVSADTLRHIEGQRQLVSYIASLTQRGRKGQ